MDGEYLFCYCDKDNGGELHYTERKLPCYGSERLDDDDMEINFQRINSF